jgi:GNAT superfamily N-acetyltransferase
MHTALAPVYSLRDYRPTFIFEKDHPKQLRWDDKLKLYMLQESKQCQGIWLVKKSGGRVIAAEAILTWNSDNIVKLEKLTVIPEFRTLGIGHDLMKLCMEWATDSGYTFIIGEARKGSMWNILENYGAKGVVMHKNWAGTGEDYMTFKLEV